MKRRYNNTLKVIDLFDIVLTNHPKILNDKILKNKRKLLIPFIYKFNMNRSKKFLGFLVISIIIEDITKKIKFI